MRAPSSPACRAARCGEIHLAGHARQRRRADGRPWLAVCDEVWELYRVRHRAARPAAHAHRVGYRHPRTIALVGEAARADASWGRPVASLRELQHSFAAALRDPAAACAVRPVANLDIYRNNAAASFRTALELSFPVLRRRVGDDYFRQLAFHYRARFPSRSGDLHWAGATFADFLAAHLRGGEYQWLADLARLEWARERGVRRARMPAVGAEALAAFAPHELEHVVFSLQPSLRLIASSTRYSPSGRPISTRMRRQWINLWVHESGLVRIRDDAVEVETLTSDLYSLSFRSYLRRDFG